MCLFTRGSSFGKTRKKIWKSNPLTYVRRQVSHFAFLLSNPFRDPKVSMDGFLPILLSPPPALLFSWTCSDLSLDAFLPKILIVQPCCTDPQVRHLHFPLSYPVLCVQVQQPHCKLLNNCNINIQLAFSVFELKLKCHLEYRIRSLLHFGFQSSIRRSICPSTSITAPLL